MSSRKVSRLNRSVLILLLSVALAGLLGCKTSQPPTVPSDAMPLYLDESHMQAEVLRHIQIGMPASEAQVVMEHHGFQCRIEEGSRNFTPDLGTPTHLKCLRVRPQDNPAHQGIVLDEILVYMPIESGMINGVKVRHVKTSM